jgi:uncharacterized membrane protein YbhN (UPF0104 family)
MLQSEVRNVGYMMQRIRQIVPIVMVLGLLGICLWSIAHELREYSWQQVWQSVVAIPRSKKLLALVMTALGYLTITGYDLLAFRYIRHALARAKIIFTSFLSYAIGNTVGFTLFSGTAIRYRFYGAWRVPPLQIAKVIGFTHLSFWVGMFAVGGVVFLVEPLTLPSLLKLPFNSVHPLGWTFLTMTLLYLLFSLWYQKPVYFQGEAFSLPSFGLSLGLIAVSALDWGLAAGVLYWLLPSHASLSYPGFFGIFVLALTAGIVSTVPGGLGVFETVILLMRPPSLSAPDVLGALLAYRGIYYFLPLIVAVSLWIVHEFKRYRAT